MTPVCTGKAMQPDTVLQQRFTDVGLGVKAQQEKACTARGSEQMKEAALQQIPEKSQGL